MNDYQRCEVCSSPVKIVGHTTKHYEPLFPVEEKVKGKPLDTGPLTRENVDQQFCSDWLKEEIVGLFDKIDELKTELIESYGDRR